MPSYTKNPDITDILNVIRIRFSRIVISLCSDIYQFVIVERLFRLQIKSGTQPRIEVVFSVNIHFNQFHQIRGSSFKVPRYYLPYRFAQTGTTLLIFYLFNNQSYFVAYLFRSGFYAKLDVLELKLFVF